MSYKTSVLRNRIIFILLAVLALTGCSWLIGFVNTQKSLLFISIGLACLIDGSLFIIYRYGQNERFSFVVLAGWYGFSFALLTLVGMLIDPRSASFSWVYFLKVTGMVGIGTFIFIILMTSVSKVVLRVWQKNFGNPMSPRK